MIYWPQLVDLTANSFKRFAGRDMDDPFNGKKIKFKSGFHFYMERFERSCDRVGMNDGERFAYLRVLNQLYSTGGHLQSWDEVRSSANISTYLWQKLEKKLEKLLTLGPEGWSHHLVIETLEKSQRISDRNRAAANKRWHND